MFSVYSNENELRARLQYAEDAAILVSGLGDGTTIRYGRVTVWTEGEEAQPAGESYDYVAEVCNSRSRSDGDQDIQCEVSDAHPKS